MSWHLFSHFVVRLAGFPLKLAVAPACPGTMAALDAAARSLERADRASSRLLEDIGAALPAAPPQAANHLREARSRVRARLPLPRRRIAALAAAGLGELAAGLQTWNRRLARAAAALERASASLSGELVPALARLKEIAAGERFREAVLLSSPSALEGLERWLLAPAALNQEARYHCRVALMYLQRFCAKNETASFFGPTLWGDLERPATDIRGLRFLLDGERPYPVRSVRVAHWVVSELARRLSTDPALAPAVRPRRDPLVSLAHRRGEVVARCAHLFRTPFGDRAGVPLSPAEARLLAAADGRLCRRELLERAGAQAADLDRLAEHGLACNEIEVPVGVDDPLAELQRILEAALPGPAGGAWRGRVAVLEEARRRFAGGTLAARREALAAAEAALAGWGARPRRGSGEMYQDRLALHEDCGRGGEVQVGAALVRLLRRRLPAILDLLWLTAPAWARSRAGVLQSWFRGEFGPDAAVPAGEFAERAVADTALLERLEAGAAEARREAAGRLQRLGRLSRDGRRLQLSWSQVASATARLQDETVPGAISVDLMFAAPGAGAAASGRGRIVLGDWHSVFDLLLEALLNHSHPDRGQLARDLHAVLTECAGGRLPATLLGRHYHKGNITVALPGPDVETWGLSPKPRDQVFALADLCVGLVSGRLELLLPGGAPGAPPEGPAAGPPGRPLFLARVRPGPLMNEILGCFGFPVAIASSAWAAPDAPHAPRVTVGRFVLQREKWRVPPDRVFATTSRGYDPAMMLQVRLLQRRLGIPDLAFVSIPEERKPVLVNLGTPPGLDLLRYICGRTKGPLTFTEMLPDPGGVWLEDPAAGGAVTFEVRCLAVRPPGGGWTASLGGGEGP